MAFLGIDTSNYTSSCSLAENNEIISDQRILLSVDKGKLGLRQSEALYQHWENMPKLIKAVLDQADKDHYIVNGIVVSTKPRPVEGSYMPVFNAGKNIADILSDALKIPVYYRSHQEGHILSAAYNNDIDFSKPVICAHLSGGTLELVKTEDGAISIVGGTKDISYGQLIDRIGVALGMQFPAGKEIDNLACSIHSSIKSPLCKINVSGTEVNISGFETQIKKMISENKYETSEIAFFTMHAISESLRKILKNTNCKQILITGGVASSSFLRRELESDGYMFGRKDLCSDNSVGLALSEGRVPW